MCQDDVENYFSLQRAHIASAQPTVLQYLESAATLNTNLLLTSEFNELNDSTGSYDPVCIPNAVKIALLRRNKSTHSSASKLPLCSDSSSSNHSFLPLEVTPNIYDTGQKIQLLRHAKQTLDYIDLSTSSTIIQANEIIVQAMKNKANSEHLLNFISCLDSGLRMHYFSKESWWENSLKKLWSGTLTQMHVTHINNELACDLLSIFVKKFTKRRCVTYLAIDGFSPSTSNDNSAIRQLLKKYDMLEGKKVEDVRYSRD